MSSYTFKKKKKKRGDCSGAIAGKRQSQLWAQDRLGTIIFFSVSQMTGGNWGQVICKSPFFPVDTALCKWLVLNLYEVLLKVSTLDQDLNPHGWDWNPTKTQFGTLIHMKRIWTEPKPMVPGFRT